MDKKKQIEEIFNIIVDGVIDGEDNNGVPTGNTCSNIAEAIYNADYRKQSEGEWRETRTGFHCSSCRKKPGVIVNRGAFLSNFCPNCGAKMKGGE